MRFPPIEELVPHAAGMLLLDRVLEHDSDATRCAVRVDDSVLFRSDDGSVPSWLAVEYMAQCVAAHAGLLARARGEKPKPGLLLGSRRLVLRRPTFESGGLLEVRARHGTGSSAMAFHCEVREREGTEPLVEGRLNVYQPESLAALEPERE